MGKRAQEGIPGWAFVAGGIVCLILLIILLYIAFISGKAGVEQISVIK